MAWVIPWVDNWTRRLSLRWLGTSLLITVLSLLLGLTGLVTYKVMRDVLWISSLRNMDYQVMSALGMTQGSMVADVSRDEFRRLIHEGVPAPTDWPSQARAFSGGIYAVQLLDAQGQLLSVYPPGPRPFVPDASKLQKLKANFLSHQGPARLPYEGPGQRQVLLAPLSQAGQLVGFAVLSNNWFPSETFLSAFATGALLIASGIVLTVVLVYLALLRQLSRPLQQLLLCARQVTGGDLSVRTMLPSGANEIYRIGSTFDRMLERLEWLFQTQKNFVADVSHELRTPLTALTGQLHIVRTLRDRPEDPRAGKALDRCEDELERMVELVEDLLTLVRAEDLPLQGASFAAGELIDECIHDLQMIFPESLLQRHPGELLLWGQRDALKRALLNVLENACNYSPRGAPIEVWTEQTADFNVVHVKDRGPGIAPEWIPRLGQRFFRPDPSRCRQTGGSGLGLSIVKTTLERHGGKLAIHSQVSQFTLVSMHLPRG